MLEYLLMEPLRPRPNFWRLHLSTVLLLVVIAGALLYVNIVPLHVERYDSSGDIFGWPSVAVEHFLGPHNPDGTGEPILEISYSGIALNSAFTLMALITVALVAEFWIRHRYPRTPPK